MHEERRVNVNLNVKWQNIMKGNIYKDSDILISIAH